MWEVSFPPPLEHAEESFAHLPAVFIPGAPGSFHIPSFIFYLTPSALLASLYFLCFTPFVFLSLPAIFLNDLALPDPEHDPALVLSDPVHAPALTRADPEHGPTLI